MNQTLTKTDFKFPKQTGVYHGKVRDVYFFGNDRIAMIATDRISAFDVVLPKGIPSKGQVLNQIAAHFLDSTKDIVPNWKISTPDYGYIRDTLRTFQGRDGHQRLSDRQCLASV